MSTTTDISPDVVKALCSLPAALAGISGMQSQLDQIISGQETVKKQVNDADVYADVHVGVDVVSMLVVLRSSSGNADLFTYCCWMEP